MSEDRGQVAPVVLPATWRDLRAVWELEKLCFPEDAWPWIDVLAALTFPDTVRLKAVRAETPLGFVIGDRRRGEHIGWIASIGVHPQHRRQGMARLLLERCELDLGMPRVRLTLRRSNLGAMQLYAAAGYQQIDLWPKYYRNGEDGLVMEKSIVG